MQPSPIAETSGPSLPSRRRCVTIVIALPFACFALRDLRPGEIAGRRRSRHHPFRGRDFRPLRSGARRDPKIAWNYRGAATVSRERVLQQSSCTMSARVFAVALSTALAAAPALAHAQWHHGYPHGYYHGGGNGAAVGADELGYDLHVLARYRLEVALLAGDLPVGELPAAWAEAMRAAFGDAPGV